MKNILKKECTYWLCFLLTFVDCTSVKSTEQHFTWLNAFYMDTNKIGLIGGAYTSDSLSNGATTIYKVKYSLWSYNRETDSMNIINEIPIDVSHIVSTGPYAILRNNELYFIYVNGYENGRYKRHLIRYNINNGSIYEYGILSDMLVSNTTFNISSNAEKILFYGTSDGALFGDMYLIFNTINNQIENTYTPPLHNIPLYIDDDLSELLTATDTVLKYNNRKCYFTETASNIIGCDTLGCSTKKAYRCVKGYFRIGICSSGETAEVIDMQKMCAGQANSLLIEMPDSVYDAVYSSNVIDIDTATGNYLYMNDCCIFQGNYMSKTAPKSVLRINEMRR